MGLNYYVKTEACTCCGHKPKQLHIGKSSGGWTFHFHATSTIRSFEDWEKYLVDKVIIDEYDREYSLGDFKIMVVLKSGADFNHAIESEKNCWRDDSFLDADGHSFSPYEFS